MSRGLPGGLAAPQVGGCGVWPWPPPPDAQVAVDNASPCQLPSQAVGSCRAQLVLRTESVFHKHCFELNFTFLTEERSPRRGAQTRGAEMFS